MIQRHLISRLLIIATVAAGLGIARSDILPGLSEGAKERPRPAAQRPSRDFDENDRWRDQAFPMDAVLDAVGLRPGMTVADIGAGWGYMSFKLARRVAPGGVVLSEDIEQRWLDLLKTRAATRSLTNIETILGREADPLLPAAGVDMIFIHAVLMWIDDRPSYLRTVGAALKPSGRLVIIEIENEGDDPDTGVVHSGVLPTRSGYLELFRRAGFEIVSSERKPGWRFPVFVLRKAAGSDDPRFPAGDSPPRDLIRL